MATDTIPRLTHIVAHLGDQLLRLLDGATFEHCRQRYAATVERLQREGSGRRTVSRVGDRDAYWSPTQAVLEEAMRFGLVVARPLPSARRYLEDHREVQHELTAQGRDAAILARTSRQEFVTLVCSLAIRCHVYLREYVHALEIAPLVCPIVTQGQIGERRRLGDPGMTREFADWAAQIINGSSTGQICTSEVVVSAMQEAARKRFGKGPDARPTDKALAEAFNDAFAIASVRARGLSMGAIDLRIIRAWTSEWLLTDQSRYVPTFEGANVIWLAADLVRDTDAETSCGSNATEGTSPPVRLRVLSQYGARAAQAVVAAYRAQAESADSKLAAPYLPIHEVRAQAAYECRVTRTLINIVLERLVGGAFPELDVRVHLHLAGAPQPPPSEPVYDRGGARRYAMTLMARSSNDDVRGELLDRAPRDDVDPEIQSLEPSATTP